LQILELQLREAQALAHFGSWDWDVSDNTVTWSAALYEMMGVDRASFRPSVAAFMSLVHPDDRERVTRAAAEQRQTGKPYTVPLRILRPDGKVRIVRGGSHAVADKTGRVVRVVGILQDVSDETAAQEALRDYAAQIVVLARRIVDVQEIQGRELASDLHDGLGPSLTALGINLRLIEDALPAELRARLAQPLADSLEQIRQASAAMRDVMGALWPHGLDDYGLPVALRALAAAFEKRTGIRVTVAVSGPERAADRFALPLYRIVQEALNNVAKHSRARSAQIRFATSAAGVVIELEDDGMGFAQPAPDGTETGWGLLTMRERAAAVGGSCEIISQSGRGVLVRVTISPMPRMGA